MASLSPTSGAIRSPDVDQPSTPSLPALEETTTSIQPSTKVQKSEFLPSKTPTEVVSSATEETNTVSPSIEGATFTGAVTVTPTPSSVLPSDTTSAIAPTTPSGVTITTSVSVQIKPSASVTVGVTESATSYSSAHWLGEMTSEMADSVRSPTPGSADQSTSTSSAMPTTMTVTSAATATTSVVTATTATTPTQPTTATTSSTETETATTEPEMTTGVPAATEPAMLKNLDVVLVLDGDCQLVLATAESKQNFITELEVNRMLVRCVWY